jgi:hypothetical protein
MTPDPFPPHIAAMGVAKFAEWAGIGKTTAWKLVRQREIPVIRISRRTLIRVDDAVKWLADRPGRD